LFLRFVLILSFNLRLVFSNSLVSSGFATKTALFFSSLLCELHYSCVDNITRVTPYFSRISYRCNISLLTCSNKVCYVVIKTCDFETIIMSDRAANLGTQNRLCSGTGFHTPFSKGSIKNFLLSLIHNDIHTIKILIKKCTSLDLRIHASFHFIMSDISSRYIEL